MKPVLDPRDQSANTYHTPWGDWYNKPAPTRDRIMPTMLGLQYYPLYGSHPDGFRAYNTPPVVSLNQNYYGVFAYSDMQQVKKPVPWDRTWKSASVA